MRKFLSRRTATPFALAATISLFTATDVCLSSAHAESTAGSYDSKVAGSTKATKRQTEKRDAPIVIAANAEKMNGAGIDKAADEPVVEAAQEPNGSSNKMAAEPTVTNDTPEPAKIESHATEASSADPANAAPSPFGVSAPAKSTSADAATGEKANEDTAAAPNPFATNDAPSTSANAPDQQSGPIEVAARPTEGDIFGQWAAKKLKQANQGRNLGPHPLARQYPDHYVVVCQAGCRTPNEQIVYMEPHEARNPANEPTPDSAQAGTDYIACVGGCYNVGTNTPIYQLNRQATGGSSNSWMSTGSQTNADTDANAASHRWYERINGDSSDKEPPETGN